MSKLKIIDKKSQKSINSELLFLSKLHNPFIVNMHYAFQDNNNLYLVIDLMKGGDLRFHISRHKHFSEEQTRFFICCIIISLEYIHKNNVIHRDIKPENLVLDENGYVRITDFGIAKENLPDNSCETSGTPGYMSPEVMKAMNHTFTVDFFALGVIGYEFMKGQRPYIGRSRKEIKEQMMIKQIEINKNNIMDGWSDESANFINLLLIRKAENRLGFKGVNELKNHCWVKYYPWELLEKKKLPAPFIPEKKENFDKRYCEGNDKIGEDTQIRYEEILLNNSNYKNEFKNFYYDIDCEKCLKKTVSKSKINVLMQNKINKIKNFNTKIYNNNINTNNELENKTINNLKNDLTLKSMKLSPNPTRNIIIKSNKYHKKSESVATNNLIPTSPTNNLNNNMNNVSNNVIYINFNINDGNIMKNICNGKLSNKKFEISQSDRGTNPNKLYYLNVKSKNKDKDIINKNIMKIGDVNIKLRNICSPANSAKYLLSVNNGKSRFSAKNIYNHIKKVNAMINGNITSENSVILNNDNTLMKNQKMIKRSLSQSNHIKKIIMNKRKWSRDKNCLNNNSNNKTYDIQKYNIKSKSRTKLRTKSINDSSTLLNNKCFKTRMNNDKKITFITDKNKNKEKSSLYVGHTYIQEFPLNEVKEISRISKKMIGNNILNEINKSKTKFISNSNMQKFHKKKTMINYNTTNFNSNNSYANNKLMQKSKKNIKLYTNDNCTNNNKNSKNKNNVLNAKIISKRNKRKTTDNEDNNSATIKKMNCFSVGDINDIKNNKNYNYQTERLTVSVNAQNNQKNEKDKNEIYEKNIENDDRLKYVGNLSKKIIKVGKNQKIANSNSTIFPYKQKQWSKNRICKK